MLRQANNKLIGNAEIKHIFYVLGQFSDGVTFTPPVAWYPFFTWWLRVGKGNGLPAGWFAAGV